MADAPKGKNDPDNSADETEHQIYHCGMKRKRQSTQTETDDETEEFETPAKKQRADDQSGIHKEGCGDMTPKRSPLDSAYGSVSPYVQLPSVGKFSDIDVSPVPREKKSHSDLVDLLRCQYKLLKANLDTKHNLAENLFQMDIVPDCVMEQLSEENNRSRRVDILIKALVQNSQAPDIYHKVIRVFNEEKIDYMLQDKGKTDKGKALTVDRLIEGETFLVSELQLLAPGLEKELEPRNIIDDLLVSGSLSFIDHEDIYKTTGRRDRVRILLENVKRAGSQHFPSFIEALKPKFTKQQRDTQLLPTPEIKPQLHRTDCNMDENPTTSAFAGASRLELKWNFGPEPQHDIEMSVVDYNNSCLNLALEEESMEIADMSVEGVEFSSVKIKFAARSKDSLTKVWDALNNTSRIQNLVASMMTQKQIQMLKERSVNTVEVELRIPKDSIIRNKCSCKLSKERIVQAYTYLEENIPDATVIIDAFLASNILEPNEKQELLELKNNETLPTSKAGPLLMKLLTLPPECICFLEKQLRCMDKDDVIEKVILKQIAKTDSRGSMPIDTKDIRRNWSYLVEEIEPKMFLSIFADTAEKLDEMISTDSREKRCKVFLRCMIKAGQKAINKFHRELLQRGMTYVADILCRKEYHLEDLSSSLLKSYHQIVEEIEPLKIRDKLVQEGIFKAREFDEITKVSQSRRDRVVWLLRKLLQKDQHAIIVFMESLKIANYGNIANAITDSKTDAVLECPFLYSKIQQKNGIEAIGEDFKVTYQFNISWKEEACCESELQLSLHKEIYKRNEEKLGDKTALTKSWINNLTDADDQYHSNTAKDETTELVVFEEETTSESTQGLNLDSSFIKKEGPEKGPKKLPLGCSLECISHDTVKYGHKNKFLINECNLGIAPDTPSTGYTLDYLLNSSPVTVNADILLTHKGECGTALDKGTRQCTELCVPHKTFTQGPKTDGSVPHGVGSQASDYRFYCRNALASTKSTRSSSNSKQTEGDMATRASCSYQVPSPIRKEQDYRRQYQSHLTVTSGVDTFHFLTNKQKQRFVTSGSPVGSAGTSDFEDISPCPSPFSMDSDVEVSDILDWAS